MDEEEVQNWYEDEKQQLFDNYIKDLEEGKDKELSEKKFNMKMEALIKKFNESMDKSIRSKEKMQRLQKKFDHLKEKLHLGKKHDKAP